MVSQGPYISQRMQGFTRDKDYPPFPPSPNKPSNEEAINEYIESKVGLYLILIIN